jgi:hypothetical protein
MRAGLGLVGLLICIGVIVWIMYAVEIPYNQSAISAGQKATAQANQFAGNSTDGTMRFDDSVSLDLQSSGGRTNSILVTKVVPLGPAATFYGLMKGDSIIEIGPLSVRDSVQSNEDAKAFVMDAYQRQYSLVVIRNDQKITLPLPTRPAASPAPAAAKKSGDGLQGQLDAIGGPRGN